jgi:predicted DNA-binding WGR domain protein
MMITLYKTDRKDRIHFYSINDRQGHLFSQYTFTANWGSDLSRGREKVYVFDNQGDMDRKLQSVIQARIDKGYRVLYSYFRDKEYEHLRPTLSRAAVS